MSKLGNRLLHRQFLPGTNRFVYWLKTPIGWLIVAAIGSALAASSIAPQMWMIFGVLLVLIGIGTLWPLLAMWGVTCKLKFDRKRMSENEKVTVRLQVQNRFWFPIWGLSLERGFFVCVEEEDNADSPIAVSLARIPAAATSEFAWEFVPQYRGIYPLENPVLSCGFPFGLWFAEKEVAIEQPIIVWPETYPLGALPPIHGASQLVSETFTDQSGTVGEKIGVRPFREGDSLRLVHWGQTARFDRLIVCEQQTPSRQTVDVVVDWQDAKDTRAAEINETCLRVGASICEEFHSHGYQVRFQVADFEFEVDARGSSYRKWMDGLASLSPENKDTSNVQNSISRKTENGFYVTAVQHEDEERGPQWKTVEVGDFAGIESANSWMKIDATNELKESIARIWRKTCQSSWQVNG